MTNKYKARFLWSIGLQVYVFNKEIFGIDARFDDHREYIKLYALPLRMKVKKFY